MGLAQLPRAYFSGFTYWNPSTMNNNDYQPTYDPASATLNWPWLERHGLQDADDFDAYATRPGIVPTANSALDPNVYSDVPPAEWNFYGDNTCGFVQPGEPAIEWPAKFGKPPGGLSLTGYTNGQGELVTGGDPWIGQPVRLNVGTDPAKMVDVDPICPWSTQLFVDAVALGSDAARVGLTARTAGRAHSRWVFFARNLNQSKDVIIAGVASAMWQLGLPAEELVFLDPSPAPGSLAAQLKAAAQLPGTRGLMVRFVTYHTVYFTGSAFAGRPLPDWAGITSLYAEYAERLRRYEAGEALEPPDRPVNRAYSNTVGWIAPWTTADMRTAATGRILLSPGPVQPVDAKLPATPLGPAVLEYAADPADPALVGRISIDLGTTIPELDSALTKVDFGTMQLAVASGDANGSAPAKAFAQIGYGGGYDKDAYVATAGVVDIPASDFLVPLTVAELQRQIVVTFPGSQAQTPQVGLQEAVYTAETDDRGVYVDEAGAPWSPPDRSLTVQVRHLGGKPPRGTQLRIAQYAPSPPGFGEGLWQLVSDAAGSTSQAPYLQLHAGADVTDGAYTTVPVPYADDGLPYATVSLAVSAIRSGPPVLAFTPLAPSAPAAGPAPVIPFPALIAQFFANVRVLPFHNAMAVAFENWLRTGPSVDLVSQRVFDSVFRTFFVMYPAMRFLRDPLQFQAWRGRICAVTDPAQFESASYMPVMRSMSAGQRRMLELWSAYLDGAMPTPAPPPPAGRRG
jgi:hypothetical protein